jgi:hypothetical protein
MVDSGFRRDHAGLDECLPRAAPFLVGDRPYSRSHSATAARPSSILAMCSAARASHADTLGPACAVARSTARSFLVPVLADRWNRPMPAAHQPSRFYSGPVNPPQEPEPITPGLVVRVVAFYVPLVGGSLAGMLSDSLYLTVGAWLLFAVLLVVAGLVDRGRPDPAREARATADEVLADLRAPDTAAAPRTGPVTATPGIDLPAADGSGTDKPAVDRPGVDVPAVREAPVGPAVREVPATPGIPAEQEPLALADLAALVTTRVEERIAGVLAMMERRGTRAQWRFFLLGIPVGFFVNWASARLWG